MRALGMQGDIAFYFGTSEQRLKAVNFDVCKKPPKLISYHSNVPWVIANECQFNNLHVYF